MTTAARQTTACLLAAFGALTLFGCASGGGNSHNFVPDGTPLDRHDIGVERATEVLEIPLENDFSSLKQEHRRAIEGFVAAYRDRGHGDLLMIMPENSANPQLAVEAMKEAREIAWGGGVAYEAMRGDVYDAGGRSAPLMLAFDVYEAVAPDCKSLAEIDLSDVGSNNELENFGCSVRYNIAKMVADPGDLLGLRDLGPRDARRVETIMENYRAGNRTAAQGGDEDVNVSGGGG